MNKRRLYRYLKTAIEYMDKFIFVNHKALLELLSMTEDDYQKIMNGKPERIQGDG